MAVVVVCVWRCSYGVNVCVRRRAGGSGGIGAHRCAAHERGAARAWEGDLNDQMSVRVCVGGAGANERGRADGVLPAHRGHRVSRPLRAP